MKTDWTTTDQAAAAAEQGKIEALECSWKHHHQGETADYCELKEAIKSKKFWLGISNCAYCKYQGLECNDCLLKNLCGKEYQVAQRALENLKQDFSNANFHAFQEAEAAICRYIKEVLAREQAREQVKEKKPCKAELRHGNLNISNRGNPSVTILVDGQFRGYKADGTYYCPVGFGIKGNPLSNIFDDLARNSEGLEEFRTVKMYCSGQSLEFGISKDPSDVIFFNIGLKVTHFKLPEATEIHQKLGQILATAKRQAEKQK